MEIKEGTRIKLTAKMVNPNSKWMPEEDIPVGTEGTVQWTSDQSLPIQYQQIGVKWDNGRNLCILPHIDKFEII